MRDCTQYPRAKSTRLINSSPRNHRSKFLTNNSVCRSHKCSLAAAKCGVIKIFSARHNGLSAGKGSSAATSIAAPAILRCESAATNSASSINDPRATLIK